MTNRITVAAGEIQLGDHIYDGPSANAHPTFAWETVTQVRHEDGLIVVVAGRLDSTNGEFWFEPDESVVVIRYPPAQEPEPPISKSQRKHGHRHSG